MLYTVAASLSVGVALGCESKLSVEPGGRAVPDSIAPSRGLPPRLLDSLSVVFGDTVVQTSVVTSLGYAPEPNRVILHVVVHDTTPPGFASRTLALSACPVSLRLYRSGSGEPAWNSELAPDALRCPTVIAPDPSRTDISVAWNANDILGDSLPAGRYTIGYSVHTADARTFQFSGGASYLGADRDPATYDLAAVQLSAASDIAGNAPRSLRATTVVRNVDPRPAAIGYGACPLNVRLYRTPDRSGPPVWRSEHRRAPGSQQEYGCVNTIYSSIIAPGDSLPFSVSIPMYEVAADSLAAGRYYVSVEFTLMSSPVAPSQHTWVQTIAAGTIDITRAPDPLPAARELNGLTYAATTRLVHGEHGADTVRTIVLVTNTTHERQASTVALDCPVQAYPYRSSALRDSIPMQAPLAYLGQGCSLYPYAFVLEAGQSWAFARDIPLAAVRAVLGAGHFWFTAWMPGGPVGMMAAGDIEIPKP